jgi:hypothetical protein
LDFWEKRKVALSKHREMMAPPTHPGDGSWGLQEQRNTAVVELAVVRCEFPDTKICAKAMDVMLACA